MIYLIDYMKSITIKWIHTNFCNLTKKEFYFPQDQTSIFIVMSECTLVKYLPEEVLDKKAILNSHYIHQTNNTSFWFKKKMSYEPIHLYVIVPTTGKLRWKKWSEWIYV